MTPSPKKLISRDKRSSATSQSLPQMGNTPSMSHLGQFLYREHICNPSFKKLISRDKDALLAKRAESVLY